MNGVDLQPVEITERMKSVSAPGIVLASMSATRFAMLSRAGLVCEAVSSGIDETAIKRERRSDSAETLARALAAAKASAVARKRPGQLIIGADQVLECDGVCFDKPRDRAEAASQLRTLRGREHVLVSAVSVYEGDSELWSVTDRARLWMRRFSDDFLEAYLDAVSDVALAGPGAYRIEGPGAQLFERIEGDHFTILGLPLLPLLAFLRRRGAISS